MPTTIQTIQTPKRWRAWDTSSSYQEIGPERVTNGDFTNWTSTDPDNWSIGGVQDGSNTITESGGGGAAVYVSDDSEDLYIVQGSVFEVGKTYRFKMDCTAHTAGTVGIWHNDAGDGTLASLSGVGSIDHVFTATGTSLTINQTGASVNLTFDNVSVKEVESFGNNNHGQIYSGRALEFDGVSDYLTADSAASIVNSDFTVAFWIKPVLGLGGGVGGRAVWSSHVSAASNRNIIYIDSSTDKLQHLGIGVETANTTTALTASWQRCIMVVEGATWTVYRNGVADGAITIHTVSTDSNLLSIGQEYDGASVPSDFYSGLMSDFQMWDALWTADDVAFDYANPEQLALNRGGTSLTESNLKLWYPMNDGHRGQQSYILDASNTGLGDDVVSNGDFNSSFSAGLASGWTNDNTATVSEETSIVKSGSAQRVSATSGKGISQSFTTLVGITYKYTCSVYVISGTVRFLFDNSGNDVEVYHSDTGEWKDLTLYCTTVITGPTMRVWTSGGGTSEFIVDNISCKPVNDKNHATTVFYGDDLWTEVDNSLIGSGTLSNEGTNTGPSTSSVTLTVDGTAATEAVFLDRPVYNDEGKFIGICTARNSNTEIVFGGGIFTSIEENDELFTQPNWATQYDLSRSFALIGESTAANNGVLLEAASNRESSLMYLSDASPLNTDLTVGRTYRFSADFATDVVVGTSVTPNVYDNASTNGGSSITSLTDIISNGNFETGSSSGTSRVWTDWIQIDSGAGDIEEEVSSHRQGTRCPKMTTSTVDVHIHQSYASAVAGDQYLLTYWSKGDGTVGARHQVYDNTNTANIIAHANNNSQNISTSWKKTSVQFTVPASCTSIRIKLSSPHVDGVCYIDDVTCVKFVERTIDFTAGHATNCFFYLTNMNHGNDKLTTNTFEGGSDGEALSDWTAHGSSTPTVEDDTAYAGDQSAKIITTGDDDGIKSKTFTTITGERHSIDFWVKPDSGMTKIQMTVTQGDGSGNNLIFGKNIAADSAGNYEVTVSGLDEETNPQAGGGTWYHVKAAYIESSGGSSAQLYILTEEDQSGTKTWYIDNCYTYAFDTVAIDNIALKEVGTATGWTEADQQLDIPQTALQSYNQLAWFSDVDASYVSIANHDDFSFGDGSDDSAFSISAWVYLNEAGVKNAIISKDEGSKREWAFVVTNSNQLRGWVYDEDASAYQSRASATSVTDEHVGKWFHAVMTYNGVGGSNAGAGMKVYLNGEQVDTLDVDGGTYVAMENDLDGIVTIGDNPVNGDYELGGSVTEVSIWGTELSQAEVNELYNDGKALDATTHSEKTNIKGYWRNNGLATWTNINNPGTHDGTPTANLTETLLQQAGVDASRDCQGFLMNRQKDTNALNLTTNTIVSGIGDGDNVNIPGRIDLGTSDFSISFWAYKFQDWSGQWIIGQWEDDSNRWYLRGGEGSPPKFQIYALKGGTAVLLDYDTTSLDGADYLENWIHVVCAVDRSAEIKWYINGDLTSTGTVDGSGEEASGQEGTSLTLSGDANIGWFEHTSFDDHHFNGKIDDVMIYDKYLSAPEVKRNYNAGKRSHR